ncbi:hypothetical protein ACFQ21_22780 [Ohtaekwangia kribbensis]|jgi:hypothetical protein|uniref:Uncharacterized protein n=1 Tax=Ohtaekwangia kribbensis TaxID=688913 RepID=A0ABW3K7W1_9BACT
MFAVVVTFIIVIFIVMLFMIVSPGKAQNISSNNDSDRGTNQDDINHTIHNASVSATIWESSTEANSDHHLHHYSGSDDPHSHYNHDHSSSHETSNDFDSSDSGNSSDSWSSPDSTSSDSSSSFSSSGND